LAAARTSCWQCGGGMTISMDCSPPYLCGRVCREKYIEEETRKVEEKRKLKLKLREERKVRDLAIAGRPKHWITFLKGGGYLIYRNGRCIGGNRVDMELISERILELIVTTNCSKIVFSQEEK